MADEKIFERLQKLKAMTTSSNPHEADTARRMVEDLIQRHGITEEDLSRFEESASHEEPVGLAQEDHVFRLATAIAQFFECGVLRFTIGETKKIKIVGPKNKTRIAARHFKTALKDLEILKHICFNSTWMMEFSPGEESKCVHGIVDGMIEKIIISHLTAKKEYELTLRGDELTVVRQRKKTKSEAAASEVNIPTTPNEDDEIYLIAYCIALERYSFEVEAVA